MGRLLKIDAATGDLRRPSVARVLVEIDVTRPQVKRVWIGDDEYGFWQKVESEIWPAFCPFCERFGHVESECFRKDPSLKPVKLAPPVPSRQNIQKPLQIFAPKAQIDKGKVKLPRRVWVLIKL